MATQNFKNASKKALYEAKVAQLDKFGSNIGNVVDNTVISGAENAIWSFIERVQNNINNEDMPVSGKINDIQVETLDKAINVIVHPHLIYQDKGVSGTEKKRPNTPFSYKDKRPPVAAFKDLIQRKNIQFRNNENNGGKYYKDVKHKSIDSVAYAMATKVYKEGLPARNIFSKEIPQLKEDLKKYLSLIQRKHQ